MMTVLFLSGCASSRKSVSESVSAETVALAQKDSTVEEMRRLTVETVPMETVTLTVSADSLKALPEGASYSARSGRASVEVKKGRTAGTLVVRASCDSLQRLVEEYERRMLQSSRDSTGSKESSETTITLKEKKHPNRWWTYVAALAAGAVGGVVITRRIKNNKTQ